MKSLIVLLVSIASLVLVKCDLKTEIRLINIRLSEDYFPMSDSEVRNRIDLSTKAVGAIIRTFKLAFEIQGLDFIVDAFEKRAQFYEETIPKMTALMDKESNDTQRLDYDSVGTSMELYVEVLALIVKEPKLMANVSGTEEELLKTFKESKDKLMSLLNNSIEMSKSMKGLHEFVISFHMCLKQTYDSFERDVHSFKTSDIRVESLQVIIQDINLLILLSAE